MMEGLKECARQRHILKKEITSSKAHAWHGMYVCADNVNHWPLYFSTVPAKSLTVVLNAPKGYLNTYNREKLITKVVVVAST